MSVAGISPRELQAVYQNCLRVLPVWNRPRPATLAEALRAVYAANRAAWYVQYGDALSMAAFEVTPDEPAERLDPAELFERIGNLEYNCWTNDGLSFLPREAEGVLEQVRLALGRQALERVRGNKEVRACPK